MLHDETFGILESMHTRSLSSDKSLKNFCFFTFLQKVGFSFVCKLEKACKLYFYIIMSLNTCCYVPENKLQNFCILLKKKWPLVGKIHIYKGWKSDVFSSFYRWKLIIYTFYESSRSDKKEYLVILLFERFNTKLWPFEFSCIILHNLIIK